MRLVDPFLCLIPGLNPMAAWATRLPSVVNLELAHDIATVTATACQSGDPRFHQVGSSIVDVVLDIWYAYSVNDMSVLMLCCTMLLVNRD